MAQCAFSNPDAKRDNLCFMNASFVASRASGIVSDHIQVRAECGHGEIFKKVAAGSRCLNLGSNLGWCARTASPKVGTQSANGELELS